jgi:outer membrane lipoprotein
MDQPLDTKIYEGRKKTTGLNMRVFPRSSLLWILILSTIVGCGGPAYVVPPELEEKLNREATFEKLSESPDAYQGHIVMITGMVLNLEILPKFTRVELLQLPLDSDGLPVTDLNASQGRFIANCHGVIDPQRIPSGTRMSVIGEMQGTSRIKGSNYNYITVVTKAIHVYPHEGMKMLKDPKVLWSICPSAPHGIP